jgi:hypothetical protein
MNMDKSKQINKTVYRDVEAASKLMRRFYRSTKETMRAMAGYLPKMKLWPAKKMLAKHIWLDANHADLLRSRTLDLRYPRVDADDNIDIHLIQLLKKLPTVSTDQQFLSYIYKVIKPALLESFRTYIGESDQLDDAPSHVYLERIIFELEKELQEFQNLWDQLADTQNTTLSETEQTLTEILVSCGGINGPDQAPESCYQPYFDQDNYVIPRLGGRDSSWEEAKTQVPPRKPKNLVEQQLWIAIDHVNEVWAAETAAALIWQYEGMPWELYFDATRWCYDEMRHSMMGEQRLKSMGFEIGIDIPMASDHWQAFREQGIERLLILLHGLEQNGPLHKSNLKNQLSKVNDLDGAQDCDFDWADESGHIRFGLAWIKALHKDWSKSQIIAETKNIVAEWQQWIKDHQQEGKHGYDAFLSRIDNKVAMMNVDDDTLMNLSPIHVTK